MRVGDRVTTTTPLTTVDKPGSLEAYVYVPIERSSQLKMNLPVQIVDQSGNVIAESRISFISPQVDSTTQTVLAKAPIANNNDKLRNAQFIHARIVWGTQQRTVVPILAVSRLGGAIFRLRRRAAGRKDGRPSEAITGRRNDRQQLRGARRDQAGRQNHRFGDPIPDRGAPVIVPQA